MEICDTLFTWPCLVTSPYSYLLFLQHTVHKINLKHSFIQGLKPLFKQKHLQPPIHWVLEALSPGIKWPGPKAAFTFI